MPAPIDRDVLRLTQILDIAARVKEQISLIDRGAFLASRNEIDMAAYRLGSIGEYTNKLSSELKTRHSGIAWRDIHDMRNALFHDYDGALPAILWEVAGRPLTDLIAVCRIELDRAA